MLDLVDGFLGSEVFGLLIVVALLVYIFRDVIAPFLSGGGGWI